MAESTFPLYRVDFLSPNPDGGVYQRTYMGARSAREVLNTRVLLDNGRALNIVLGDIALDGIIGARAITNAERAALGDIALLPTAQVA